MRGRLLLSGVQSRPFQSIAWRGAGTPMPSHQMSPSSVSAQLVKMSFRAPCPSPSGSTRRTCRAPRRRSPPRVDGIQPAVRADLHPGDVVAERLSLPARDGRLDHRQVGLAAGRGERGRDMIPLALRADQPQDQHVLGHPAFAARHGRGDAQREALLAQQRVAAVARAVRPDQVLVGEVADVLLLHRRAGPLARRPRRARAARRSSADTGRSRRRPPAPRSPARPTRVMMCMLQTTYGLSVISTPIFAIGEPIGPIENGMTYMVRPRHAAIVQPQHRLLELVRRDPVVRRARRRP